MINGILIDLTKKFCKGLSEFLGNSSDNEFTSELYLENSRLEAENTQMKEKMAILKTQLELSKRKSERLKRETKETKISLNGVKTGVEERYEYLSPEAKDAFVTAEYMYNAQKEDMDYSGIYLLYVKGIEIQLRKYLGASKSTFGSLMIRLRNVEGCERLANFMLKNKVVYMRNRGVHRTKVTKQECGKLRKIIVEDRWLERVHMGFHTGFSRTYEEKRVNFSSYIYEADGYEQYGRGLYRCYIADNAYILSDRPLENGRITGIGKKVLVKGIEYILV